MLGVARAWSGPGARATLLAICLAILVSSGYYEYVLHVTFARWGS